MNEVACAILGVERAEALGRRFESLGTSHPHYLRLRAAVGEFLAHPERERDGPRDGALPARARSLLRAAPDAASAPATVRVAGLILVLQDVTYLRDQEARREQLMATLSHELRTPLTSLRMAVELLRRASAAGRRERGRCVDAAHEDVVRLEDVAQRLLDVSRSRAMSIALERQTVDLDDVVERGWRGSSRCRPGSGSRARDLRRRPGD